MLPIKNIKSSCLFCNICFLWKIFYARALIKASIDAKFIKVATALMGKEDESIAKRLINTTWAISRTSNTYDWAQAILSKGIQDDFITPEDIEANNKNNILSNYGLNLDVETNNIHDEHYGILKQDNNRPPA